MRIKAKECLQTHGKCRPTLTIEPMERWRKTLTSVIAMITVVTWRNKEDGTTL